MVYFDRWKGYLSIMVWIWQQVGWPDFSWQPKRLAKAEERFLVAGGAFAGMARHLGEPDNDQLVIDSLSAEAITTSEIEGEILDRASVQSSIRRHLGFITDNRRVGAAEQAISEMMVDLHRSFAAPLSNEMLFEWHRMLTGSRRDLKNIGRYRTHREPMQIVSGPIDAPVVHFEAPPSADMPREMSWFIDWFNRTAPDGAEPLPALTRAGIAHFYFVCIHPFEDGNGRIGRALAEKILAQSLGRPTLIALAATILNRRRAYYETLARTNTSLELTEWLAWFAAVVIEAQRRTMALAEFLIDKTRLLDRMRGQLNERQRKVLVRVLREGPEGFKGGLSARNYVVITGASAATATRDLAGMVERGALVREGERRHARYHANIARRHVVAVAIDEQGRLVDAG
ncbi:MAG TPA: Fic family protein [Acetobacteraceae bacterium]|nr:Fic family protein [Acetobacteraceae bacterium]